MTKRYAIKNEDVGIIVIVDTYEEAQYEIKDVEDKSEFPIVELWKLTSKYRKNNTYTRNEKQDFYIFDKLPQIDEKLFCGRVITRIERISDNVFDFDEETKKYKYYEYTAFINDECTFGNKTFYLATPR